MQQNSVHFCTKLSQAFQNVPAAVLAGFRDLVLLSGIFTPLFVSPPKLGQALAAKLPEMLCNTGNLE